MSCAVYLEWVASVIWADELMVDSSVKEALGAEADVAGCIVAAGFSLVVAGTASAARVGILDSLAVIEVVMIVWAPGVKVDAALDAGAVGSYCSSVAWECSDEVDVSAAAVGTEGVPFSAAGGSIGALAAVAFILAGHGVLPGGSVVSSVTSNLRVLGAMAANTDNGPGVVAYVVWTVWNV